MGFYLNKVKNWRPVLFKHNKILAFLNEIEKN